MYVKEAKRNFFFLIVFPCISVSDVTSGTVTIDLKLLSMIKVNKELDLGSILQSDVMHNQHCPLTAGDLTLEATGKRSPVFHTAVSDFWA